MDERMFLDKIDVLDLIIMALTGHEKRLDELITRLERTKTNKRKSEKKHD